MAGQERIVAVRGERGATLIELLVTVALLAVAMLLATALILESVRVFGSAGRALTDPSAAAVGGWLRRDCRNAAYASEPDVIFTSEPLSLRLHDGSLVIYQMIPSSPENTESLVRKVQNNKGETTDERVILSKLCGWRWRSLGSRMVEVVLVLAGHLDPTTAAVLNDPERLETPMPRIAHLCFGLRSSNAGRSW